MPLPTIIHSSAAIDRSGSYRYSLWRWWDTGKDYVAFVLLNPSTADAKEDDPTVRRCIGFAHGWGYGGICIVNLFALRATDPTEVNRHPHPIGKDNDRWLRKCIEPAAIAVAGWGTAGNHMNRGEHVRAMFPHMKCLGQTKGGHPRHPLYLSKDTELVDFDDVVLSVTCPEHGTQALAYIGAAKVLLGCGCSFKQFNIADRGAHILKVGSPVS